MNDTTLEEGTTGRWEHFPHDADIGIRGLGLSKADAFEQGAVALTAVITDPQFVSPVESMTLYFNHVVKQLSRNHSVLLLVRRENGVFYIPIQP